MNRNDQASMTLAGLLLQIKAIKLNPAKPFTWASGLRSPIYCDNRITLSHPKIRTYIRQEFSRVLLEKFGKPDVIAAVATGAIAHGALVAQELGLPMVYVRTEKKGHGLNNQIEGIIGSAQSVVVIEDLISTGGSSLNAVQALREAEANVKGLLAIFSYELPVAIQNFADAHCEYATLTNFESMLSKALEENYINEREWQSLKEWKLDPHKWSEEAIKNNL